jgi:ABC-type uncharacterized transport system involved in gliding motility auxiliary subunit
MKHPKKIEALLYSALGVAFMFLVIVGLNLIFSPARLRVDMTSDKLYTLTEGTKKILAKVDAPIEIRFYCSRGENRMPSNLKNFAQNVDDLLEEFRALNPKNIVVKHFDPKPDSDTEDLARLDGVEAQPLSNGEQFYMGVTVSLDPQKVTIPISVERERLLEYDVARAIARVMSTNKPVVGLLTPLPMAGMQLPPQMMMQMRQRNQDPWIVVSELKRDFEVQSVPLDADKIDESVKVLLVVHPKNITDKTQYAIDQFIMRGGKLIAFLDPACLVDQSGQQAMGMNMGGNSSLPKLLKAWGLEFDTAKVAADLAFTKEVGGPDGRPRVEPSWLFINPKGINNQDAIMSQFDNLLLPCAGVFTGTPAAGLKMDTLLHTTKDSETVEAFLAAMGGGGQKTIDEFKPSGNEMKLAVRLTGKFKTAFPDGKPAEEKKDDEKKDDKDKGKEESLKECKAENVVYLIGDADMLYDNFSVRKLPMFGMVQPFNGNLTFAQSLVEQMAGDKDLIGVRSRASIRRPFTVVEEMRAEAQRKFQSKIGEFEKQVQEAQTKISEIQSKKEGNQRFILSPEAQKELASLQEKQARANKDLRRLRKELRQEEESLENRLKWVNIAAMPLAVASAGVVLAVLRKRRTVAR